MSMPFRWIAVCLLGLAVSASGQTPTPQQLPVCSGTASCAEAAKKIVEQFGPELKLVSEFPPLFGDMDGDGEEDAAVVATGNALGGQGEFGYKVIDPYNSYFGWSDPKVTSTFEQMYPGPKRHVLVVHSWKAQEPKAKFVIINLAFQQISLARATVKKKTVMAISTEEASSLVSITYWDGKRYRWRATSMGE